MNACQVSGNSVTRSQVLIIIISCASFVQVPFGDNDAAAEPPGNECACNKFRLFYSCIQFMFFFFYVVRSGKALSEHSHYKQQSADNGFFLHITSIISRFSTFPLAWTITFDLTQLIKYKSTSLWTTHTHIISSIKRRTWCFYFLCFQSPL